MTEPLFRDEPYLRSCEATVTAVSDGGLVILDRTCFYPTGGGQPGDSGSFELENGGKLKVINTLYGETKEVIAHQLAECETPPQVGERLIAHLDWQRRYKHMRVHTALHLLSVVLPYPVTGGQISEGTGRLDFDIPEATLDKEELTAKLQALVDEDHPVTFEWITEDELNANPDLVKTMSVKPPTGSGRVRLIRIGEHVDLQPCGGTHVSHSNEIGRLRISKLEKKGRQNRRVRIELED
ncbi:alanyl-tRNA editing protein [Pseudovibrio sp. SPO723]|uniref:alanyl-tRNA editing protein n=1 Tax=Nesiotobacter zosterae TaxID=392721 RepID=UPI0029C290A3|nr:alanyl-tRNA editing protein [Pseudovibrio sp. SPO723]MDX5592646.1 alanyl-tRNA editing protein [Pseudovibrio sp. SPO723]